tara:strand:- start:30 stop:530 length:501 start_codon:yes stop_codon:yes gene_type:complete
MCSLESTSTELTRDEERLLHFTIKSVGNDLRNKKFNTAISRLMEFVNEFSKATKISSELKIPFIKLIAPFAPHLAEELWQINDQKISIFDKPWPKYNEDKIKVSKTKYAIQVNGKLRGDISVDKNIEKNELILQAKNVENVQKFMNGKSVIKEIVVPNRLINFVVK